MEKSHSTKLDQMSYNSFPIFFQPWWLDVVCQQSSWGICEVKNANNEFLGVLPYYDTRLMGFKIIRTPPLTPFLGIWINPYFIPQSKLTSKYSYEIKVTTELIDQLPRTLWYHQIHPPQFQNWLPFHWKGFRQTTRYVYTLNNNEEVIWKGMKDKSRNMVKKALSEKCEVDVCTNAKEFYNILHSTLKRNKINIDKTIFFELHGEILNRGQGKILLIREVGGHCSAGVYLLVDGHSVYLWQLGLNKSIATNGAVYLLIWESIKFACEQKKKFNFCGSMLPHIEPVFRSFGAERIPIHQIYKASNPLIYIGKELLNLWKK